MLPTIYARLRRYAIIVYAFRYAKSLPRHMLMFCLRFAFVTLHTLMIRRYCRCLLRHYATMPFFADAFEPATPRCYAFIAITLLFFARLYAADTCAAMLRHTLTDATIAAAILLRADTLLRHFRRYATLIDVA